MISCKEINPDYQEMLMMYVNLSKSFNEICEGDNYRQQQFSQIKNSLLYQVASCIQALG